MARRVRAAPRSRRPRAALARSPAGGRDGPAPRRRDEARLGSAPAPRSTSSSAPAALDRIARAQRRRSDRRAAGGRAAGARPGGVRRRRSDARCSIRRSASAAPRRRSAACSRPRDSGPLRHRYGAPRDLVLGITVALSDGTIARSGGKVIKNVAGYDLAKLFTGSFGTLGRSCRSNVRLHPLPHATATALGACDRRRDARRRGPARCAPRRSSSRRSTSPGAAGAAACSPGARGAAARRRAREWRR